MKKNRQNNRNLPASNKRYSLFETKAAGLTRESMQIFGLPVDKRRKSCHPHNVERLRQIKEERLADLTPHNFPRLDGD